MFETLETRKLFAATVTFDDDTLFITGDTTNDVVTAQLTGDGTFNVTCDGVASATYELDDVDHIEFEGGAGSDSITLGRVNVALFANGGKGNDSISASGGFDLITGGGGEDYLFGGNGDDLLDGGIQGDVMLGSGGSDRILGGSTNTLDDVISGGDGNDSADFSLYSAGRVNILVGRTTAGIDVSDIVLDIETIAGTSSNDIISTIAGLPITIEGLAGNDQLTGGRSDDSLVGGLGDDVLTGNPGNDFFDLSEGGNDSVFGGRGDEDSVGGNDAGDVIDSVENN